MKKLLLALLTTSASCLAIAAPSDTAQRESEAITEQIKQGNSDKERWARISLYSDSNDPEDLGMHLVSGAGLVMKLNPLLGHLEFSTKGSKQVFAISTSRDAKRSVCPRYNLRVLDASAKHAVLRRVCNEHEFRPNRFIRSVDYFLYDAGTATMRMIWHSETTQKGSPLPVAKPVPTVRVLPIGYQFDWKSQVLSKDSEAPTEIHTSYVRQMIDGTRNLICTDIAAPKGEGLESGYCEGERPPLVKE